MSRTTWRLFERALHPFQRRRRQLRAARIPRRPRARPGHRRGPCTSATPTSRKAISRSATMRLVDARDLCRSRPRARRSGARSGSASRRARTARAKATMSSATWSRRLIGALFLDGGIDAARAVHPRASGSRDLAEPARAPPASQVRASGTGRGAQGRKPPVYEVVGRTGAHHAPEVHRPSVGCQARRSDRGRHRASRKPKPPRPRRCWSSCNE